VFDVPEAVGALEAGVLVGGKLVAGGQCALAARGEVGVEGVALVPGLNESDWDLAVERAAEAGPHGAKAGVSITLATLVVTCSGSPVIAQMLGVLRDWLRRREDRRITLTVNRSTFELSSTSASQEYIVVREWLEAQRPLDQ